MTELPDVKEKFKVIYSGGEKNRRGVGIILRGKVGNSVLFYRPISERILVMSLKGTPVNVLIIQVYAPNEDGDEKDKEQFYEMLDQAIVENRKGNECLMVMGDLNGKVGKNKEEDIVGPYGLGERNENGQLLVEFCKRHNLFVTNTWFQQKTSAQHTWTSPDGTIKNQIDYVLIDKRYRNGVKNSKSMPGADCGSDHNPIITRIHIKLKGIQRKKKNVRLNLGALQEKNTKHEYQLKLDKQLKENKINELDKIDQIWDKIKESIGEVAEEISGTEQIPKRQKWMNSHILSKIYERRKFKSI